MKNLIVALSLLTSFASFASEIDVLKVEARAAGRGKLITKFVVNVADNTAGVSVKVVRKYGGKNPHTSTRTFKTDVSELSLNGDKLELNIDGKVVDCGTMGVTRILKLPVLKLSGNCDVVAKRVNGAVVVSVVAE